MLYEILVTEKDEPAYNVKRLANEPAWTADTAKRWAHMTGRELPCGTVFVINRRRTDGARWKMHRSYLVDPNGIVRRTDRTGQHTNGDLCPKCGWPHVGEACVTA